MSSLVVFPFRHDDTAVLERSLTIAANHPSVGHVLAVGDRPPDFEVLESAARATSGSGAIVEVIQQDRIGRLRPGKGDAMLTGLGRFVEHSTLERLHFYDADIRTFVPEWITRAEEALDGGADVAKHFFHRSASDAQITWHVTKAGSAILWPNSSFPDLHQPLGGELALTRAGATALWADPEVRRRSDWGIDTVLTFSMIRSGLKVHEVFMPEGKAHGYYGSLTDLRTMFLECLDALQGLAPLTLPDAGSLTIDDVGQVPEVIRDRIAYDVALTRELLAGPISVEAARIGLEFPAVAHRVPRAWSDEAWGRALRTFLAEFALGDPAWEEVAFRAWVGRVLHHTEVHLPKGYEAAIEALEQAVTSLRA